MRIRPDAWIQSMAWVGMALALTMLILGVLVVAVSAQAPTPPTPVLPPGFHGYADVTQYVITLPPGEVSVADVMTAAEAVAKALGYPIVVSVCYSPDENPLPTFEVCTVFFRSEPGPGTLSRQ